MATRGCSVENKNARTTFFSFALATTSSIISFLLLCLASSWKENKPYSIILLPNLYFPSYFLIKMTVVKFEKLLYCNQTLCTILCGVHRLIFFCHRSMCGTRTRFETEAKGNLEIAYCIVLSCH